MISISEPANFVSTSLLTTFQCTKASHLSQRLLNLHQWEIKPFKPEENLAGPFKEESSFATLFPKYREKYLREVWSAVTKALDTHVRARLFRRLRN